MKKVRDVGVFTITSLFSLLAYGWFYFVLVDKVVKLYEAIITFSLFVILMVSAYTADKINEKRTKACSSDKLGESGGPGQVDEEDQKKS